MRMMTKVTEGHADSSIGGLDETLDFFSSEDDFDETLPLKIGDSTVWPKRFLGLCVKRIPSRIRH